MGLYPTRGEILFQGKPLKLNQPKATLDDGIAFVSEDRRGIGLLLDSSIEIEDNIAVTTMQTKNDFLKSWGPFKLQDKEKIRQHAESMIKEYDIRCIGPHQYTKRLSGGNQQKVCLARAVTLAPDLLLVSEPTRGIDIGAKKLVLDNLLKLNEEGMTIIMTSSELAELRSIADRIAIISDGKLAGILDPTAPDADFGLMMAGNLKGGEDV